MIYNRFIQTREKKKLYQSFKFPLYLQCPLKEKKISAKRAELYQITLSIYNGDSECPLDTLSQCKSKVLMQAFKFPKYVKNY